jgi:acetyl-CoA acetyltransferase
LHESWISNRVSGVRGRPSFLGRTAIAGVGYTEFTKRSERSVLDLATEACRNALDDCGVPAAEVEGIVSFSLYNDSVACQAVASALAVPELSFALDLNLGGQAPSYAVLNAAMAVSAGLARNVLVYRALNGRSGVRIGTTAISAPTAQYRYPIGFTAYPQYVALWARRFMIETGAGEDDLAAVVIEQRRYAALNERAARRSLLSREEYAESPFVVEPFRIVDCTTEVDGACAVLVTSLEEARKLEHPPVVVEGGAWVTGHGAGLDIADPLLWPDLGMNCQHALASRLWGSCGLAPGDMDLAEIYDCFSSSVLFGLEGLGLVGKGGSGEFVRSGETRLGGSLPVNTNGGLLCEGYVHGMNTVNEAVLQLQGRCGERQVEGAARCAVTSGVLGDGSAMVLVRDGG